MAPGLKTTLLVLSQDERAALERIARRRKAGQALTTRARVVLALRRAGKQQHGRGPRLGRESPDRSDVARTLPGSPDGGLDDAPRNGAPRKASDEEVERLVSLTLNTQPEEATHWSTRDMAKAGA